MYCLFLMLFILTFAIGIPLDKDAVILNYDFQNNGRGNYQYSYETSNGIQRNETGVLVNVGQDNEHIAVHGFYGYTDPEGRYRFYKYTADENGYHINLDESNWDPNRLKEEQIDLLSPPVLQSSSAVIASLLGK